MHTAIIPALTDSTLALILAGGQGTRLKHLTQHRAKPAVPFGGNYRIIDFAISNCVNSGIRRIGVLTQHKPRSLLNHIEKLVKVLRAEFDENLELFSVDPPQAHYAGTADAVYRNLDLIRLCNPDYTIILAGDHVYKMDYAPMLAAHLQNRAELTVGCIQTPLAEAGAFGVMGVDADNRVIRFTEKPTRPDPIPEQRDLALVSTGIYIFNTGYLIGLLSDDAADRTSSHDFGKNIIPAALAGRHAVFAFPFLTGNGEPLYWRDVGTIDAYWQTSMELLETAPPFDIHDNREWPLWSAGADQFTDDVAPFAMRNVTGLRDSFVSHSLLFDNVCVGAGACIKNSVILPNVTIGRHCHIENAVIDEGTHIPDFTLIGKNRGADLRYFHVSEHGVVLVNREMLQNKTENETNVPVHASQRTAAHA